jgi:MFS family permease
VVILKAGKFNIDKRRLILYMLSILVIPIKNLTVVARPQILASYGLTYEEFGYILGFSTIVTAFASFAAGIVAQRAPTRVILILPGLLFSLDYTIMALSNSTVVFIITNLMAAVLSGFISYATMCILVANSTGDETGSLMRLQFFISGANTITPPLIGGGLLLLGEQGWRIMMLVIGFLQAMWLLSIRKVPFPQSKDNAQASLLKGLYLLGRRSLWVLLLLSAFHVGADNAASEWIVLLTKERFPGCTQAQQSYVVAALSLSYFLGRFILSFIYIPAIELQLIGGLTLIGVGALSLAVFVSKSYMLFLVLIFMAWLCFSGNWPFILGCASRWFGSEYGTVLGLIGAFSSCFTAVTISVMGKIGDTGLRSSFIVVILIFLLLSITSGVAGVIKGRWEKDSMVDVSE